MVSHVTAHFLGFCLFSGSHLPTSHRGNQTQGSAGAALQATRRPSVNLPAQSHFSSPHTLQLTPQTRSTSAPDSAQLFPRMYLVDELIDDVPEPLVRQFQGCRSVSICGETTAVKTHNGHGLCEGSTANGQTTNSKRKEPRARSYRHTSTSLKAQEKPLF